MGRLLLTFLAGLILLVPPACRRRTVEPRAEYALQKVAFQIGDTKLHAHVTQAGPDPLTMVHLHEDEQTSVEAARVILKQYGGRLIELVHGGERRITFVLHGARYSFDPNRIFSEVGVSKTVRGEGTVPAAAHAAVSEFAAQFVRYFALQEQQALISLHNNSEGGLTIASYQPGAVYEADTNELSVNPDADPDNFYYVTDAHFFRVLSSQKFNVILQDNRIRRDDGSLSVFAGRHRIPYINVEAQDDQLPEQIRMLEVAVRLTTNDQKATAPTK